jgi:uncharacterized protein
MKNVIWIQNEAQKKRFEDHKATVSTSEDGTLRFESSNIITPKGLEKTNRLISIIPKPEEQVVSLTDAGYLFAELKQMNIILTNACNLSCSYCYEQHNKDFGRFTNDSLYKAYKFLIDANKRQKKVFQFFGGEPLIHKDIILNFLKEHEQELDDNAKGDSNTIIGMVTNGLLFSKELIDEYLSYDFTYILISLDTDRSSVDHREIGQEGIDKILDFISYMPAEVKEQQRITIRCTLARENAPYFKEFVDNLYGRGIRRLVVHPLVLDSSKGFIRWKDNEWSQLHQDILYVIDKYQDLQIHFSEGVGEKEGENCMIGADMIAIDASGDFSGCYFFTNQKAGSTADTILGNVFQNTIYLDRYKKFQIEYSKMFEEEEQCKTCDYKNACYQCPAGNLDTGSKMFRPDDMCQKIVKLYIDLQEDIARKHFKKKFESICSAVAQDGENSAYLRGIAYLFFYHYFNYHPKPELVHKEISNVKYQQILYVWKQFIDGTFTNKFTPESFVDEIVNLTNENEIEVDDFYFYVINKGRLVPNPKVIKAETEYQRSFYFCLFHMVFLQSSHKTFTGSIRERLLNQTD